MKSLEFSGAFDNKKLLDRLHAVYGFERLDKVNAYQRDGYIYGTISIQFREDAPRADGQIHQAVYASQQ